MMMNKQAFLHRFAAGREELMARAEEAKDAFSDRAGMTREELTERAGRIREQFAENVTADVVTNFVGWTLVSSGVAWGVADWMSGRRMMRSLIGPIALLALGTAILSGNMAWQRRGVLIGEAEARVRDELHGLDPLARLRVLRDVASQTVPFVHHIGVRN